MLFISLFSLITIIRGKIFSSKRQKNFNLASWNFCIISLILCKESTNKLWLVNKYFSFLAAETKTVFTRVPKALKIAPLEATSYQPVYNPFDTPSEPPTLFYLWLHKPYLYTYKICSCKTIASFAIIILILGFFGYLTLLNPRIIQAITSVILEFISAIRLLNRNG